MSTATDTRLSLLEIIVKEFGIIWTKKPSSAEIQSLLNHPYGEEFLRYVSPRKGNWELSPIVTLNKGRYYYYFKHLADKYSLTVRNHKLPKIRKIRIRRKSLLLCSPILVSRIIRKPVGQFASEIEPPFELEMNEKTHHNKTATVRELEQMAFVCGSCYLSIRDILENPNSKKMSVCWWNNQVDTAVRNLKEFHRLQDKINQIMEK